MTNSLYRVEPLYVILSEWMYRVPQSKGFSTSAAESDACEVLRMLCKNFMPSGSGIDTGTEIDIARSTPDKLIFTFGFHFIDEHGFYDGWEDYTVKVTPSLRYRLSLTINGKNRNDIKDYLHDTYYWALKRNIACMYDNTKEGIDKWIYKDERYVTT